MEQKSLRTTGLNDNPYPGSDVATLGKALNDNYLNLVASNKQQTYIGRGQMSTRKLGKMVH